MPWQEVSTVSLRQEFVMLATQDDVNMRELCRRYRVSAKTGYKWLQRHRAEGLPGLDDRSRRPRGSPTRTAAGLEQRVLAVRAAHPAWGGRKIRRVLERHGGIRPPTASTVTAILHRHALIDPATRAAHRPMQRFEHAAPNDLWQMDFMGHFALRRGRCHPLTVLDDHSRFALGLEACNDETTATVQQRLTQIFRRYGVPRRLLMDNGRPWGGTGRGAHTALTAWLIHLGIHVCHGRPYHPQTQGKDERFHRTVRVEVVTRYDLRTPAECQHRFDHWRPIYNCLRPHAALDFAVPAHRYHPSARRFPDVLPPIVYGPDDVVRKVQDDGTISYRNAPFLISQAFHGYPVALRPTTRDGQFDVFFCHQKISQLDLRSPYGSRRPSQLPQDRRTPANRT